MTELHFAATAGAARNLENEGVDRRSICVTGNSGIDAVLHVKTGWRTALCAAPNGRNSIRPRS